MFPLIFVLGERKNLPMCNKNFSNLFERASKKKNEKIRFLDNLNI